MRNAFLLLTMLACSPPTVPVSTSAALPNAIVYKTYSDYTHQVAIRLSADQKEISYYPDPADVAPRGSIGPPTELINGYWLDNSGLATNSAFIKLTFKEYSALKEVPTHEQLMQLVVSPKPFVEMWDLGPRTQFKTTDDINQRIRAGLRGAKQLIRDGKVLNEK